MRRSLGVTFAVSLLLALPVAGCSGGSPDPGPVTPRVQVAAPDPGAVETVRATRWVSTSAEYRALALQAYAGAMATLRRALSDSSWTASVEQEEAGDFEDLPPAVILDVDETVLDNIPFQDRLIERNSDFDPDVWDAWVAEAAAESVPGAAEFTRRAAQMGVSVFYVTNRDSDEEEPTRANLVAEGFPLAASHDALLTQGERPGWTGDKTSRRSFVARRYRILLLVGDDLGDFVSDEELDAEGRRRLVERHRDRWGERWVVLPNPVYGGWLSALGN